MLHHVQSHPNAEGRPGWGCLLALLAALLLLPRAAGAAGLAWQPAEALGDSDDPRPRFVYFHAEWCSWCRQFERRTLRNPRVMQRLARDFIPIRLDADRERVLFRRLGGRGLPYTALLGPDGARLGSFTGILDPQPFLQWLAETAGENASAAVAVTPELFHETLEDLWESTAERFHGVSLSGIEGTKRPQPLTALYLLEACFPQRAPSDTPPPCPDPVWRERLPRLLDRMLAELEDPVEGGFYFYAEPGGGGHTETAKRLERNVRMARLYLTACERLEVPRYCRAARKALAFIDRTLWDETEGAYRAGQHSDAAYFALPRAERVKRPAPPVDAVFDAAANAQALILLHEAARRWPASGHEAKARRIENWLLTRARLPRHGFVDHRLPRDPPGGEPGSLYTQAWVATALWRQQQTQSTTTVSEIRGTLERLLAYIGRFHYEPASGGFSESPTDHGDPFTHPAANGRLALLLLQLPPDLKPTWAQAALPGVLRQIRWRPGVELDDVIDGVHAMERLQHAQNSVDPPRPAR